MCFCPILFCLSWLGRLLRNCFLPQRKTSLSLCVHVCLRYSANNFWGLKTQQGYWRYRDITNIEPAREHVVLIKMISNSLSPVLKILQANITIFGKPGLISYPNKSINCRVVCVIHLGRLDRQLFVHRPVSWWDIMYNIPSCLPSASPFRLADSSWEPSDLCTASRGWKWGKAIIYPFYSHCIATFM